MRAARPAFFLVSTEKRWFRPDCETFRRFRFALIARRSTLALWPLTSFSAIGAWFTFSARLTIRTWFTRFTIATEFALSALFARRAAFGRSFTAFTVATLAVGAIAIATATAPATAFAIKVAALMLTATELSFGLLALTAGFGFGGVAFSASVLVTVELGFVATGEAVRLRLRRRSSWLHRTHQPEIVISVLEIVLAENPIPRRGRVTCELQVALINERRRPTHLTALRPRTLHGAVRVLIIVIVVLSTTAGPTATATLTLHMIVRHIVP